MKIKTAIKTVLFTTTFLLLTYSFSLAQQMEMDQHDFDVNIRAHVNIDIYSQLALNPTTVEIFQPSTVTINMVNSNGIPRVGRQIEYYVVGDPTNVTIVQPTVPTDSSGKTDGSVSSTVPGAYTVCARDITGENIIDIVDCKTLYVTPVPAPIMLELPQYSRGNDNTVMWNMPGTWTYQYYVEISLTSDFSTVVSSSGWINNRTYQFQNLQDGQMYFYRVKARNSHGGESDWSNIVFSVQDARPPLIELISISEITESTIEEWDSNFVVNIRYRITDNIGVNRITFWCLDQRGERYNCRHTTSRDGDFFDVSIYLRDLERFEQIYLFKEYGFCVEATDLVGNVSRNCDALLQIPFITRRPMRTLDDSLDTAIGRIEPQTLQDLSLSMTLVNVAFSLATLLVAFGHFPYLLIQLFLGLQTLIGLRKKSNVGGYVYNSFTKEPVPQAMVRVFDQEGRIKWWDITDRNGYFLLPTLEESEYKIDVVAKNYIFPSTIISGKTDFPLENLYYGEIFSTKDGRIPDFSIPIDEDDLNKNEEMLSKFMVSTKKVWKILHIFFFMIGLLFSIYALRVMNIWWNYLIIFTYIFSGIVLLFNLFNKREKYGQVLDENKNPVKGVIVAIKNKETGELISKRVTDSLGRYRFVVARGLYGLTVMNSNIKPVNEDKHTDIQVNKDYGKILSPNILVRRLEDSIEEEDVIEPLKEL